MQAHLPLQLIFVLPSYVCTYHTEVGHVSSAVAVKNMCRSVRPMAVCYYHGSACCCCGCKSEADPSNPQVCDCSELKPSSPHKSKDVGASGAAAAATRSCSCGEAAPCKQPHKQQHRESHWQGTTLSGQISQSELAGAIFDWCCDSASAECILAPGRTV